METMMQAIELETSIIKGEIRARLPQGINAKKARLIVMYEEEPLPETAASVDLLNLLDNISAQRDWPIKSRREIDKALEEERVAWD